MGEIRSCSRATCTKPAIATMTFDYRGALAVLGPLAPETLPGTLDLCEQHVQSVTVPVGWELVRLQTDVSREAAAEDSQPDSSRLTALADALREAEKAAQKRGNGTRNAQGASSANMPPNPWISHVPLPPVRPHLSVIDGGAGD